MLPKLTTVFLFMGTLGVLPTAIHAETDGPLNLRKVVAMYHLAAHATIPLNRIYTGQCYKYKDPDTPVGAARGFWGQPYVGYTTSIGRYSDRNDPEYYDDKPFDFFEDLLSYSVRANLTQSIFTGDYTVSANYNGFFSEFSEFEGKIIEVNYYPQLNGHNKMWYACIFDRWISDRSVASSD